LLPGMFWIDIIRSPYAHARIVNIDASKALAVLIVLAVITGTDLEKYGLHLMPTLVSDTQMVLPTDTVKYLTQQVCAVIATELCVVADAIQAVEVEHKELKVVVDSSKVMEPGATLVRPDKGKDTNHILHRQVSGANATDATLKASDIVVKQDVYIPPIHVASIETCGCMASFDKVEGKLTV
jgi:carbon-monoxide dehydrogenase large subunit